MNVHVGIKYSCKFGEHIWNGRLICPLSVAGKAVMAPNLDPFGRDRAAYQELSRQRRVAEREARRSE